MEMIPMPVPTIIRKKFGNLICRIVIYSTEDNQGSVIPDFQIEIYFFGIQIYKGRITL